MKLHTMSFFYHKGKEGPTCHISLCDDPGLYPVTITINSDINSKFTAPYISFHLTSPEAMVAFKNSVLSSFNKVMKEAYDE